MADGQLVLQALHQDARLGEHRADATLVAAGGLGLRGVELGDRVGLGGTLRRMKPSARLRDALIAASACVACGPSQTTEAAPPKPAVPVATAPAPPRAASPPPAGSAAPPVASASPVAAPQTEEKVVTEGWPAVDPARFTSCRGRSELMASCRAEGGATPVKVEDCPAAGRVPDPRTRAGGEWVEAKLHVPLTRAHRTAVATRSPDACCYASCVTMPPPPPPSIGGGASGRMLVVDGVVRTASLRRGGGRGREDLAG